MIPHHLLSSLVIPGRKVDIQWTGQLLLGTESQDLNFGIENRTESDLSGRQWVVWACSREGDGVGKILSCFMGVGAVTSGRKLKGRGTPGLKVVQ